MDKRWYKEQVVYQIYPQSFCDSNQDGIGDLKGIQSKLDYIQNLGAQIIWLSPIYLSPLDDNGYDIADYYQIHPRYGTMADFDDLVREIHGRGMKLVMDLVVNHTSDEHHWFQEAIKGKDNSYHDYYLWLDKPNNWMSLFGGKACEYVASCDQYYLHLFSKKQPDLNWENPKVREEIKKMLHFWLNKGVDGFRCDVINLLSKTPGLPNGKASPILSGREHYMNGPHIHRYLEELKMEVWNQYDCFTVGECVFLTPEQALTYIEDEKELNMVFQFQHMDADCYFVKWFLRKFRPIRLKKALSRWQEKINGRGWNSLYFENHDQPRSISRFGNENYRFHSATFLATYLFCQQGTPFIYQGQEIGMSNAAFPDLEQYQDVETKRIYQIGKKIFGHKNMMKRIQLKSRDNARTPMQWSDKEHAGFTTGTPWIEVNPNYKEVNVEKNEEDQDSILHYYRKLLELRKNHEALIYGSFQEKFAKDHHLVCYERNMDHESFMILGNFSEKCLDMEKKIDLTPFDLVLSNYKTSTTLLKPYEIRIYIKR
ncbi:MAG: alpha-glucosidase [Bacilli bacterium]|jgi:oligo-1,6-glucosidase|nr:alpha-glucosidase [Bacilli bacterium]